MHKWRPSARTVDRYGRHRSVLCVCVSVCVHRSIIGQVCRWSAHRQRATRPTTCAALTAHPTLVSIQTYTHTPLCDLHLSCMCLIRVSVSSLVCRTRAARGRCQSERHHMYVCTGRHRAERETRERHTLLCVCRYLRGGCVSLPAEGGEAVLVRRAAIQVPPTYRYTWSCGLWCTRTCVRACQHDDQRRIHEHLLCQHEARLDTYTYTYGMPTRVNAACKQSSGRSPTATTLTYTPSRRENTRQSTPAARWVPICA